MASLSDDSPVTCGQLKLEMGELHRDLSQTLDRKLEVWAGALEARLSASFERAVRVLVEQHQRESTILDEKHQDLPARVTRLEAAVFPPKRSRRRS